MVDYKEMYLTLFRQITKAIQILQEAQTITEEMFMSTDDTQIQIIPFSEEVQEKADTHNGKT